MLCFAQVDLWARICERLLTTPDGERWADEHEKLMNLLKEDDWIMSEAAFPTLDFMARFKRDHFKLFTTKDEMKETSASVNKTMALIQAIAKAVVAGTAEVESQWIKNAQAKQHRADAEQKALNAGSTGPSTIPKMAEKFITDSDPIALQHYKSLGQEVSVDKSIYDDADMRLPFVVRKNANVLKTLLKSKVHLKEMEEVLQSFQEQFDGHPCAVPRAKNQLSSGDSTDTLAQQLVSLIPVKWINKFSFALSDISEMCDDDAVKYEVLNTFGSVSVVGSRAGSLYAGIEGRGFATLRLQTSGTRILICAEAFEVKILCESEKPEDQIAYLKGITEKTLP